MDNYIILTAADTASNWEALNTVPRCRELFVVYDDKDNNKLKFKIGDGVSRFCDLKYVTDIDDLLPYVHTYVSTHTYEGKVTSVFDIEWYEAEKRKRIETPLEDKT